MAWRYRGEPLAPFGKCVNIPRKGGGSSERGVGRLERPALKSGLEVEQLELKEGAGRGLPKHGGRSYKEALLLHLLKHSTHKPSSSRWGLPLSKKRSLEWLKEAGRCFRCLARDHCAAACRDPVRCLSCWRTGHRAKQCKWEIRKGEEARTMNLNRDQRRRARPGSLKSYVPYTEELLRRTDLRRNAMLVDVVQPEDLGLAPQQTLANALAWRFGGYAHDFFCREI